MDYNIRLKNLYLMLLLSHIIVMSWVSPENFLGRGGGKINFKKK